MDNGIAATAVITTAKILLDVCIGELESCVCMVTEKAPDCVGVPLIAPLEPSKLRPVGSEPPLMLQVYGAFPPLAVNVAV